MARYGMPYKGSKSQIAEWVVGNLPSGDVFVDLFAGGCAVTHAAMVSGKYGRFIANDILGTTELFKECINGDMDGYSTVVSREEFHDISVKHHKRIHFSWDGMSQDRHIEPGLETLAKHGLKPWRFMFYVLVGFNTSREYDMYRIKTLSDLGANPYVMPFDKSDPYQKHLARWCNNKVLFKTVHRFDDYEPWAKHIRETA